MPRWDHTLDIKDIFHNPEMSFEEKRDEIVSRIKASGFYAWDDYDLNDIVWCLQHATDAAEWDEDWDHFYDWTDENRVWVITR